MPLLVSLLRVSALFVVLCLFCFAVLGFAANGVRAAPAPAVILIADAAPIAEADFVAPIAAPARAAESKPLVTTGTELGAPGSGADWQSAASTLFQALGLALVAWVVKLLSPAALKVGDWLGHRSSVEDLLRDARMMAYGRDLGQAALTYALNRLGYKAEDLKDVRIRNGVLDMANRWGAAQFPEYWRWIDQNQNGQIDFLEGLIGDRLPVVDHAVTQPAAA